MTTLIVNLIGLILIGLIIWWFVISKPKAIRIKGDTIDISVHDGIYDPSIVKAKKGQTLHLRFFRQDETPCSEIVIFDQLNLSAELPIGKPHEITLTVKEAGEYDFTCQMGMYRGKLIVE